MHVTQATNTLTFVPQVDWRTENFCSFWEKNIPVLSYQSPILPDQVLLDTPHMEGIIFIIKFTYLKIFDVRDF